MSPFLGGLDCEPFSNSPDPTFLLGTRQHATCLQELEISLRLRRGLCVVTGDIGTGKTTLCRCLLRNLAADPEVDAHLLLDPRFGTSEDFLRVILAGVARKPVDPRLNLWRLKETLKQQLFRLGVVEKRLVLLVIDEGQKISRENLEILREMLNYETNTAKLLQIVIFGQRELEPLLDSMPNLADRIALRRRLHPMSLGETSRMIRHRLVVAAGGKSPAFGFTRSAVVAVHFASRGSPRRSVRLCHRAMLEMLVRRKKRIGLLEALAAIHADGEGRTQRPRRAAALIGVSVLAVALLLLGGVWRSRTFRPAAPQAAARTENAMRRSAAQPSANEISAATATLLPEAAAADARNAADEGGSTGDKATLLTPRDEGPAMRRRVVAAAPPAAPAPSKETTKRTAR